MMQFSSAAEMGLQPQEYEVISAILHKKLVLGVPKETAFQENRVALTPQAVQLLVSRGNEVIIESEAGVSSFFSDMDYSKAGASIVFTTEEVYKAHVIVKVSPVPADDLKHLKPGQIIFSVLNLPNLEESYLRTLLEKKITCIAFEYLKDSIGNLPIVRSMSEIAGSTSMLIAAEYLSNQYSGCGKLLGGITGIPPSKVVILGAGTVGEYAARTAIGLGADVKIFDNSIYKLQRIQNNLGVRVFTSIFQPEVLRSELSSADVAVGAIHSDLGRTPMIVTDDMVKGMKAGAVIVDVSIDQGGCFETSEVTTHKKPVFSKYDVVHYCVPNIPSRVSKTASIALSNVLVPLLLQASENGGIEDFMWIEKGLRAGVYCYNGSSTNRYLSSKFKINFTNLELLAAARF